MQKRGNMEPGFAMEGERTDASRASGANQIADVYMLARRECNGFV
jgi:hypothetical protein